jgi:hypothetical protein
MTAPSQPKIDVDALEGPDGTLQPAAVSFGEGDPSLRVLGINDRWQDEQANYFMVRLQDGSRALVRHDLDDGAWTLVKREQLDA